MNTLESKQYKSFFEAAALNANCSDLEGFHRLVNQAQKLRVSVIDFVLDAGVLNEELFLEFVARDLGMRWTKIHSIPEDLADLKVICGAALAIRYQVVPLSFSDGCLTLACYDPLNLSMRQMLSRYISAKISFVMASRRNVRSQLSSIYGVGADTFEKILEGRDLDVERLFDNDEASVIDEDDSEEASVLRFVNQIIREALIQKATDIHVEPQKGGMCIRYRVDGHLLDVPVPENINALQDSVIARLKIMSRLDVAERRTPQDGRIHLSNEGQSVDVRVATIPSVDGETVSLRLLNQDRFNIAKLDLEESVDAGIREVLKLSNGVILATGPTGSGKSTSLYCFLDHLNDRKTRIVTIEDPVENKLPGIVQIAVRPEVGLSFAKGLRSILRADPNIVMVGEIRDTETAEIAIRASLTGHLVFSTLHTNDAIGGISRLLDMGVEPFLVSASVRAFLAQRLLRKLCSSCKVPIEVFTDEDRKALKIPDDIQGVPYRAVGCNECRNTGYSGRVGIYELCKVTQALEEMITKGADLGAIEKQAYRDGFEPMRIYGWRKVMKGITSVEEVLSSTPSRVES
jgi:type II secretory ATPase GspE/PulE/Tfp pilus assembly ATPase PilB-like protein